MIDTDRKVRVAFIGAGALANRVHYPSLSAIDDVEIVGICDLNPVVLNDTADRFGISERFSDYREMLRAVEPDAVYAIGQPEAMYDVWRWCLSAGLDLFVEKPLGLTIHQARTLALLAEQNGCVTQVGFQRRNSPLLKELAARCRTQGDVVHAICRFYKNEMTPMQGARDHMMDDGVHSIDTLRAICGGEVTKVTSTTKRVGVADINFIHATIEFDTGATGILINSWSSGRRVFGVEIHAPGIYADADLEGFATVFSAEDTIELTAQDVAGSEDYFVFGGFKAKSEEFIASVRSRVLPSSHFGDAVKTMEVAERILAQALLAEV